MIDFILLIYLKYILKKPPHFTEIMNIKEPKSGELSFAEIEMFPHYLILTIHEGVLFDSSELQELFKFFEDNFPNKDFGYISNRIHDYTINPTCYLKAKEIPNLKCMAVICNNDSTYRTVLFEQKLHQRSAKIFDNRKESIRWVESILKID